MSQPRCRPWFGDTCEVTVDGVFRLEGASSSATLDLHAQTLTFEHHGSVSTDQQKALSPVRVPLGAIASVECRRGRSTNWFWVVRRGRKPWREGVWADPCGVVSVADPRDFTDRVLAAVAAAAPVVSDDIDSEECRKRSRGWAGRLGRAVVDGFFNTR